MARSQLWAGAAVLGTGTTLLGLTLAGPPALAASASGQRIPAVGAENQYANVIQQVGGQFVAVAAVMSNPNTDPHSFEASPQVASAIASARLVVQNGLGYDSFMNQVEAAAPRRGRQVIDVQRLLGLSGKTRNPHLWYQPRTMPKVARAVARDLGRLAPDHAGYFTSRARAFIRSLAPWASALAKLKAEFRGAPVATTEPVGDYLLQAAGLADRTPWALQADIMNGVDPSPQEVSFQESLLRGHRVRALLYNQQVTDSLTASFLALAQQHGIPVVGVYETMPTPGYDYQSWMTAETRALARALSGGHSTRRL